MAEEYTMPISSSNHEIEEIFDEPNTQTSNPPIHVQKTDDLPINLFSSHDSASNANTRSTKFKKLCPLITLIFCVSFLIISSLLILLVIYFQPLPPRVHSDISNVSVHNLTVNNINTTFSIILHNPNQRVDLNMHSVMINLDLAYSSVTSTHLVPVYLKAQEHKYFRVNFSEKIFEIKPKVYNNVVSALMNKKYIFSLTIRIKMRVHLHQIPFTFPYSIVLNCFVITYGPSGPVVLSSCHKQ